MCFRRPHRSRSRAPTESRAAARRTGALRLRLRRVWILLPPLFLLPCCVCRHGNDWRFKLVPTGTPEFAPRALASLKGSQGGENARDRGAGAVAPASFIQGPGDARFNLTISRSRLCRNADRSFGRNGLGPPVISPAERS